MSGVAAAGAWAQAACLSARMAPPTQAEVERIVSLVKVLATGARVRVRRAARGAAPSAATSRGTTGTDSLSGRGPARRAAPVRKLKEDRQPVCVSERLFVGSVGVRVACMPRATALCHAPRCSS